MGGAPRDRLRAGFAGLKVLFMILTTLPSQYLYSDSAAALAAERQVGTFAAMAQRVPPPPRQDGANTATGERSRRLDETRSDRAEHGAERNPESDRRGGPAFTFPSLHPASGFFVQLMAQEPELGLASRHAPPPHAAGIAAYRAADAHAPRQAALEPEMFHPGAPPLSFGRVFDLSI